MLIKTWKDRDPRLLLSHLGCSFWTCDHFCCTFPLSHICHRVEQWISLCKSIKVAWVNIKFAPTVISVRVGVMWHRAMLFRCFSRSLVGQAWDSLQPAVSASRCTGPACWRAVVLRPGLMTPSFPSQAVWSRQASENTQSPSALATHNTYTAYKGKYNSRPWTSTHTGKHPPLHAYCCPSMLMLKIQPILIRLCLMWGQRRLHNTK